MSTTPTNLPVPSEKPQDLKFNAGKIDEFVTSMSQQYIDRFGNAHYTIEGLRWVAQQAIAAFGYITMDSFQAGATLTLPNQVLRDTSTGEYYRWDGAFPKAVPVGSTPDSTGGVGVGVWLSVGSAVLSGKDGSEMVGHGENTVAEILYAITDVTKVSTMQFTDKTRYTLKSWRPVTSATTELYGGGEFVYVANLERTKHDGGTIIDVTVPYVNDADYLDGVGSSGGNGCLVRTDFSGELNSSWFGAMPSSTGVDSYQSLQKMFDSAQTYRASCKFDSDLLTSKPLVIEPQLMVSGNGKFKTFIFKTTNSTSGLPDMDAPYPDGTTPTGVKYKYDVDSVIILKPFNDGEYATGYQLKDFTVENSSNPSSGLMPASSYGIYAPSANLCHFSNIQFYKVGYALYSKDMWMTRLDGLRSFNTNSFIVIDGAGTSIHATNCWAHNCYYGAYSIKGIGYSTFTECAADGVGGSDHASGFIYSIQNVQESTFNIACETTKNIGVLYIKGSDVKVRIQARYGIEGGTDPVQTISIDTSTVIFESSAINITNRGSQTPYSMSNSRVVAINSPYITQNAGVYDNNSSVTLLDNGVVSVATRTNGINAQASISKDIRVAGIWDNGRIIFENNQGTLFTDGSGHLRWKSGGVPSSNSDGTIIA
ncbi:tail fiber/spike domain-containing protein [Escherichia coli]